MEVIHAIILGIVQGLSEFLPISSSGHLIIVPKIMDWHYNGKAFDVALHIGTFFALIIFYRREFISLAGAFFKSIFQFSFKDDYNRKLVWMLLASAIPGALVGVAFNKIIEKDFSDLRIIAALLIIFAVVLWLADRRVGKIQREGEFNWWDAVSMGAAQAIALFPGVSRSGITMTAGLLRGFSRKDTANYSFLISLPIIGGAALYEGFSLFHKQGGIGHGMAVPFMAGIMASFISGIIAIKYLLKYVSTKNFNVFIIYRLIAGALVLVWTFYHPVS
ncbi:MAG: undecaprenyl-diphosphate phosphatase [Firmicutes bacterium]|nr:undecaprenyl-diphosphate phosphatase [Bacillota bacterium]